MQQLCTSCCTKNLCGVGVVSCLAPPLPARRGCCARPYPGRGYPSAVGCTGLEGGDNPPSFSSQQTPRSTPVHLPRVFPPFTYAWLRPIFAHILFPPRNCPPGIALHQEEEWSIPYISYFPVRWRRTSWSRTKLVGRRSKDCYRP